MILYPIMGRYLMYFFVQQGLMPALDSDMAEVITGSEFIVKAYTVHWERRPTDYFYAKGVRWGRESRAIQASNWEITARTNWWHAIGWKAALCLSWVQRTPLKHNVCGGCIWLSLFNWLKQELGRTRFQCPLYSTLTALSWRKEFPSILYMVSISVTKLWG